MKRHRAGQGRDDAFNPTPTARLRNPQQFLAVGVGLNDVLKKSARRGVVLIVVLVLVVMIALAGFGFVSEMTTEYEATKINGDLLQAQQVMASAEAYLAAHVEQQKQASSDNFAFLDENSAEDFRAMTLRTFDGSSGSPGERLGDDAWRFAIIKDLSSFDADWQQRNRSPHDEFDELNALNQANDLGAFAYPEFGLANESSKLNLGRVLYWDTIEQGRGRHALLQVPGMTDEAADSILDWIDADDTPRQFGAETDYYRQQQRNVKPRNGIPATLTELLFVRGVSRTTFSGSGGLTGAGQTSGWEQFLTVSSTESTISSPPKIAVSELLVSDLADLEKELTQSVPEDVARYVVLALMVGITTTTTTDQLKEIDPLEVDLATIAADSLNPMFELPDLLDSFVLLTDSETSRLVRSPLTSEDPESLRVFARLEQLITAIDTTLPAVRGRINILTAREEVLRALTDDPATASQIVQQRASLSGDERQSSAWLLSRRILDLPTYRRLYADITTGGDVYSGEIIVYRPVGGPFLRREITIDAANGSARRINWLDKSSLPLPLTLDQLERVEGLEAFD